MHWLTYVRTNTAPSIGPLLGAVLAASSSWRWIFWFQSLLSGICWLAFAVSYPETTRSIIASGNNRAVAMYHVPLKQMQPSADVVAPCSEPSSTNHLRFPNPLVALHTLRSLDSTVIILCIAIFYVVYTCLQVSLSTILTSRYSLTQTQGGLIYLPFGLGCMISAIAMGKGIWVH